MGCFINVKIRWNILNRVEGKLFIDYMQAWIMPGKVKLKQMSPK